MEIKGYKSWLGSRNLLNHVVVCSSQNKQTNKNTITFFSWKHFVLTFFNRISKEGRLISAMISLNCWVKICNGIAHYSYSRAASCYSYCFVLDMEFSDMYCYLVPPNWSGFNSCGGRRDWNFQKAYTVHIFRQSWILELYWCLCLCNLLWLIN